MNLTCATSLSETTEGRSRAEAQCLNHRVVIKLNAEEEHEFLPYANNRLSVHLDFEIPFHFFFFFFLRTKSNWKGLKPWEKNKSSPAVK